MNTRYQGGLAEAEACRYIESLGMLPLCKNYKRFTGEIDLIAKKDDYLVFIEVKYRADERFGAPEAAVDFRKQKKIIAAAQYYLYKNRIPFDTPCRFDVAGVTGEEIRITENAFWM